MKKPTAKQLLTAKQVVDLLNEVFGNYFAATWWPICGKWEIICTSYQLFSGPDLQYTVTQIRASVDGDIEFHLTNGSKLAILWSQEWCKKNKIPHIPLKAK